MTKGERIKALREQADMSQEELAKRMNTTKQTIYKYEKDIVTNIPSDRVEELAQILNSTPEYILGWKKATAEDKKISDTKIGIADRIYNDSEFLSIVEMLDKLSPAQLKKAKGMLNLLFEESIDEMKK